MLKVVRAYLHNLQPQTTLRRVNKQTFPRELRLLAPVQFKAVFEQPLRASTPQLTLLSRANTLDYPRLGLTVAKKHLKRAHDRNRIKRIVRESFRLKRHALPSHDFVFVAKGGLQGIDNQTLFTMLEKLWQRHIRLSRQLPQN